MSRVEAREVEPADLPALRRQFQAWRARKRSGEAIPRSLWQGAAALARRHGAIRIALALGLDSHKLKQVSLGRWPSKARVRAATRAGPGLRPGMAEGKCTWVAAVILSSQASVHKCLAQRVSQFVQC